MRSALGRRPPATRLEASEVCVLSGGRSSEREVSLVTGRAVLAALRAPQESSERSAPARVLAVEIEACGTWRFEGQSATPERLLESLAPQTIFFLALHGGEGEGGAVQGLLEVCGRTFTGSGVGASALGLDKAATRTLMSSEGLTCAPGALLTRASWRTQPEAELARLEALSESGWFVKPRRGGSSLGASLARSRAELHSALEAVLGSATENESRGMDADDDLLVEARVPGIEATCGVLGNCHAGGQLRALPPVEILPRHGDFFDYREKYDGDGAREICPPQKLSGATCRELERQALACHRALGCNGYSRTDFIVPLETDAGSAPPVLLEVNTLPGLTERSLLPLAAQAAGLSFRELCLEILELALTSRVGPRP